MMKNEYDVIVVGAGPAGSMTAYFAAKGGASVLVLEKDRDVGYPVRCAEGISHVGITNIVPLNERWIRSKISKATLISPDLTPVDLELNNEVGYILDRRIFDYDLAIMAASAGANVQTKAYVYGILKDENGKVSGVKLEQHGKHYEIRAKIVVGADGVESRVGRWAGIRTFIKVKDMEACAQATVSGVKFDSERMIFYFGEKFAPGGYLWIFPKGDDLANIGLGLNGDRTHDRGARRYLDDFLKAFYPEASILTCMAGGVPVAKTLKKFTADGFLLAGDAARMVNPISGGGIAAAMLAGKLAGETITEALQKNDFSEKFLQKYVKRWEKAEGNTQSRLYNIKEVIYRLTDEELNDFAKKVIKVPDNERTVLRIFRILLMNQPMLLKDVILAFAGI